MMGALAFVPLAGKLYISFDVRYQMADPADYKAAQRLFNAGLPGIGGFPELVEIATSDDPMAFRQYPRAKSQNQDNADVE